MSVGEHGGEGFAHVDSTPSSHSNNRLRTFFPSYLGESLEVIGGGFALILERNKVVFRKGG